MDIPTLDDNEFERVVAPFFGKGLTKIPPVRFEPMRKIPDFDYKARAKTVLDGYERITGFHETNFNAIWHHKISLYGPPCERCGKVLRTPVASKCLECGLAASRE